MRNVVYNMDCMKGMKEYPDKYFDLAIVDPVYGDVSRGGYMKNQGRSTTTEKRIDYPLALWEQEKTGKDYFDELFRVSKNQIVWGGGTTSPKKFSGIVSVGSVGINTAHLGLRSLTVN